MEMKKTTSQTKCALCGKRWGDARVENDLSSSPTPLAKRFAVEAAIYRKRRNARYY